jgi:decaprenylphospho-beta-D-erythro-pentofuranosid-2-ulose 2-reductase
MTAAVILGAGSGIARALAHRMATGGMPLLLAGRDVEALADDAADLRIRYGVEVYVLEFEAADFDGHELLLDRCWERLGDRLDTVVLCYGSMFDQADAEADFALVRRMIDVNYASPVSVLGRAGARLADRGGGTICAVGSVAGDRGRQSNFLYGSTKAALAAYLQGLRNRLARRRVAVLTVKPGFVDTAMTWGKIDPDSPMVAPPDRVARDIVRAIRGRRDEIYSPWFWRWIMRVIRSVPEPIFKRMSL